MRFHCKKIKSSNQYNFEKNIYKFHCKKIFTPYYDSLDFM